MKERFYVEIAMNAEGHTADCVYDRMTDEPIPGQTPGSDPVDRCAELNREREDWA